MNEETYQYYRKRVEQSATLRRHGRVTQVIGLMIEANGPVARIGDVCLLQSPVGDVCKAEVVGFKENRILLMPLGEPRSIGPGCQVIATGQDFRVRVGTDVLGRVLDGLGEPIDEKGPLKGDVFYPTNRASPNPLLRKPIEQPLSVGVRSVDAFLTVGCGQRIGIFAGSGVGKSTLLGMMARYTKADVNVIALVGERGREVREFLERDLGADGLARSVIIVATSEQPALVRIKSAFVATSIAEFFRDRGLTVNLMMDSVTRFAMAQREVGLAVGEPPTTRGYTPSVFALLPKLLERAGNMNDGSITGFYTVLVDGDDLNEPVADSVRGILDGHIVLSRTLSNRGHFPAIDVKASLSRLMSQVAAKEHRDTAVRVRRALSLYADAEDLIRIGAYQKGVNPSIDTDIAHMDEIERFLRQDVDEMSDWIDTIDRLVSQFGGMEL